VKHVIIQNGTQRFSLDDFIQHFSPRFAGAPARGYRDHVIDFPSETRITAPDDGEIPLGPLRRIHVRAGLVKARVIRGPVIFDPCLLVPDVKVRNISTGEENTFSHKVLELGFDTVFVEGMFYEQPNLSTYYYCDRIEGDLATLYLVESFQLGRLIQSKFTQNTSFARLYVAVSDKAVIQRLKRRLDRLKSKG
jgi:hypothetical protein